MIDAVNVPVQNVAVNGSVLFANTRIRTGCSVRHEEGSGRFVTLKPGVYQVAFNANITTPTGGALGPLQLEITQEGEVVAGSKMVGTPAAIGTLVNVSTVVLIRVYCDCCVSLGVRNTGALPMDVQDANFVITREC